MPLPPPVGSGTNRKSGAADLAAAREWVEQFVMKPHEQLGRDGAVCPFVQAAMKAETFLLENWTVEPEATVDDLVASVNLLADTFEARRWASRNRMLHTMVVVLDGLAPERFHLLDDVHALAKPGLVKRGLMFAQFYPECDERAVRNPALQVARAPVPMLAMRRMAQHDVLFLDSDPEWFAAFAERFSARYRHDDIPDPALKKAFAQAREQWGERS
jgi:heptaprenyl diphosphate synthase